MVSYHLTMHINEKVSTSESQCANYIVGRILSIAWQSTFDVIVTGGIDNIRVWSASSGHAIQRLTPGRVDPSKETIVWALAVTKYVTDSATT